MNSNRFAYTVVSWNIRGLGHHEKCDAVRDTISISCPHIVYIQESKLADFDNLKCKSVFPSTFPASPSPLQLAPGEASSPPGTLSWSLRPPLPKETTHFPPPSPPPPPTTPSSSPMFMLLLTIGTPTPSSPIFSPSPPSVNWVTVGDFNLTNHRPIKTLTASTEVWPPNSIPPSMISLGLSCPYLTGSIPGPLGDPLPPLLALIAFLSTLLLARRSPMPLSPPASVPLPTMSPSSSTSPLLFPRFASSLRTAGSKTPPSSRPLPTPGLTLGFPWMLPVASGAKIKALKGAAKNWSRNNSRPSYVYSNPSFIVLLLDLFEEHRNLTAGELLLRDM